jgi:predicted Zn-dependent peptidase
VSFLGRTALYRPVSDDDEILARISAVTLEDVNALAHELLDPATFSYSIVGPQDLHFE